MQISRIISAVIYMGSFVWAVVYLDSKEIFMVVVGLAVPIVMIWYPNEINDYTIGTFGEGGQVDKATPSWMISGFGWVILLGFMIFVSMKIM